MTINGKTEAFILVIASAVIHASWNVAARHLKGNFSILVLAHFIGGLMALPAAFYYGDFSNSLFNQRMWYYLAPTIIFQAAYTATLSIAYSYGDVGLVYPLARGTAIVLATTASQLFSIGTPLQIEEYLGIITVLSGISILAYDAYLHLQQDYEPIKINSNEEEINNDIELSTQKNEQEGYKPCKVNDEEIAEACSNENENSNIIIELSTPESKEELATSCPSTEEKVENTNILCTQYERKEEYTNIRAEQIRKITLSIVFALCVGLCTACYSITDSVGVNVVPALTYSCMLNMLSALAYAPYIYMCRYEELLVALQSQKIILFLMGPAITGAYLIILFVFEIHDVNVAVVVTLREFSVFIGTLLGIFVLREQASLVKVFAVSIICSGMAIMKLA